MADQPAILLLRLSGSPTTRIIRASIRNGIWRSSTASCMRTLLRVSASSVKETIQEAPCMAHIHCKFFELMDAHQSPIATEAVERIAAL